MQLSNYLNRNKKLAMLIAAATAVTIQGQSAIAQDESVGLEEITVTGSRIRMTDGMAAPTPVTAITPDELSTFDPGATVAEQLDSLPQFFRTVTAQRNGGSLAFTVGSFLNMRDLGANRTLVLLDGARMAPGDKRGSVNVDTFPTALVRTVDVVTGGASAAYGADALGGVTNFVIDRQFQGLKINVGSGITEFGDGFRANASIAGGFQVGDRLNIIASAEARQIDQITRYPEDLDSDWYRRWGTVQNPDWSPGAAPGTPRRLTMPNVVPTDRHPYGMITGTRTELDGMVFNREGTAVRPLRRGDYYSNGFGTENSMVGGPEAELAWGGAYGPPITGNEVAGRSLFAGARYQFTDSFSGYAQAVIGRSENGSVTDRATTTGITFRIIWSPRIAIDNVYLPEYVREVMEENGLDEITVERDGAMPGVRDIGIDSVNDNTFTTETYTVGFDYDFANTWTLGGSFSSGETRRLTHTYNMNRVDRMFLGMDAVVHPETGAIVCRVNLPQYSPTEAELHQAGLDSGLTNSRTDADPVPQPLESPVGLDGTVDGCIPYNVFGNGNISEDAIEYVGTLKKSVGIVEQDFAEVLTTGEIFEGWGYGPVSMAAGLTWRESSFSDEALPESVDKLGPPLNVPELGIRGIPRGYTGGSPNLHKFSTVPKISGKYDVWEWFGEINAPIWESTSGAQSIGASFAYRQSDYNLAGTVDAWKIGIDAQILESLRLRATQSRDVREASFSERFDAQGGGGGVDDPVLNTSYGITVVASGNPNLDAEKADTSVIGFVFEPTWNWAQGLSLSVDWYEVEIEDAISQIGTQDVVDRCHLLGIQEQCANIERDPATGSITRVFRRFFNQDQAIVEGIDFEARYSMEPNFFDSEFENLSFRLLGGKLLTRHDVEANGTVSERMDTYTLPELTANLNVAYSVGPWSAQMQGRYISGGKLNRNWVEGVDIDRNWIPSNTTWNGVLRYSGELNNGGDWNVGLTVVNLFDKHPPMVPGRGFFGPGNQGANNQYEIYGRRYNLSLNMQF